MSINILGLVIISISLLCYVLGLLVFFASAKRTRNVYLYLFMAFSIGNWSLATFFYNNPVIFDAKTWLTIVYILSYFLLISQGFFMYYFPRKIPVKFWRYFLIILILIIPSFWSLVFTERVVVDVIHFPSVFLSIASMGDLYILHMAPNVLGTIFLAYYFFKKQNWFEGFERSQMQLHLYTSLMMVTPILLVDYFAPVFYGVTQFYITGPIFVIFYIAGVAYSMLRQNFFEISSVIELFVEFLVNAIINAIFFLFVIFLFENIEIDLFSKIALIVLIIAPVYYIASLIIRSKIKNISQNTITTTKIKSEKAIEELINVLNITLKIEEVFHSIKKTIKQVITVENVDMLLINNEFNKVLFSTVDKKAEKDGIFLLKIISTMVEISKQNIYSYDEIKRKLQDDQAIEYTSIFDFMSKHSVSLIINLGKLNEGKGMLLIKFKKMSTTQSFESSKFFSTIELNTNIAISRLLLYKQAEEFAQVLEKKVIEQTSEITKQRDEISEQLRKERDMMDILGHELRTPLSISRNSIALLLMEAEKTQGTVLPKDRVIELSEKAMSNLRREVKILETVLSSTKIENKRIQIIPTKVDCGKIIQNALESYTEIAVTKNLKLLSSIPKNPVVCIAGEEQLQEIIDNLVDNAIKYTTTGTVKITLEDLGNEVCFGIIDTGEGIPKEDIPNLGKKFFRSRMYLRINEIDKPVVRPGGTGIGLYVVKGLLSLMNGRLEVDSIDGKGSTFKVFLPK